jgi:hypothetical protein
MSCPIPAIQSVRLLTLKAGEKNDSTKRLNDRTTYLKISNKQQLKVPDKDSNKQEQQTYCIPTDTNSKHIMLAYKK